MKIVDQVHKLPITKVLYDLKAKGKCPMIKVMVKDGKPKAAILKVSGMDYYFHPTFDNEEKRLEITQDGEWFSIPFDGWNISL